MELLVVVLIIGVLAGVAVSSFLSSQNMARDNAAASDTRNMRTAATTYAATNGQLPTTVAELVEGGFNPSDGVSHDICTGTLDGDEVYVVAATHNDTPYFHWNITPVGTLQNAETLPADLPCTLNL